MTLTIKTLGLTLGTVLACGAIGLSQSGAGDGRDGQDGHGRRGLLSHFRAQRLERREFVRSLQITPEQRAQALQAARELRPAAQAVREQAKRLIDEARAANPTGDRGEIRASIRERIQALRESLRERIEPSARALAATLTPEQRAILEARAKAHGVVFDENRFAARIGRRLARPRAAEFLERRQAR